MLVCRRVSLRGAPVSFRCDPLTTDRSAPFQIRPPNLPPGGGGLRGHDPGVGQSPLLGRADRRHRRADG